MNYVLLINLHFCIVVWGFRADNNQLFYGNKTLSIESMTQRILSDWLVLCCADYFIQVAT